MFRSKINIIVYPTQEPATSFEGYMC